MHWLLCTYRSSFKCSQPSLSVHGLGTISLPLCEQGTTKLRQACHQAPFGKGRETIVDTSVRNTWELNANQFELRIESRQAIVDRILRDVAKGLRVAGGCTGIRAELYKLLLYDEGAFFDSHTEYVNLSHWTRTSTWFVR